MFLDTPGLHKPRSRLGDFMVKVVNDTVAEVDVAVLVVDPVANVGHAEQQLIEQIKNNRIPSILVINKIDLVDKAKVAMLIDLYKNEYNFSSVIPVSTVKNINLDVILEEIEKNLNEGPAYYDIEEYTDQTTRQLV